MNNQDQHEPIGTNEMRVSVIIPVYNAARYVRQAVDSAAMQPEVTEIILVEDASSDDSWEICQQIAADQPKVRLCRHPSQKNRGAGASRNFGLLNSTCEYIAFLDADDYYLPGRFLIAKKLFEEDKNLDGVYEAVIKELENESAIHRWKEAGLPLSRLNTVRKRILPEDLFKALLEESIGGFHLNGLMIKRQILSNTGYFDEDLSLHEDTAFKIKTAAVSRLAPGRLDEPVAIYRVHEQNQVSVPRSINQIYKMKIKLRYILWKWGRTHLSLDKTQLLLQVFINEACILQRFSRPFPKYMLWMQKRMQLILLAFDYPAVIVEKTFWQAFLMFYPGRWRKIN